MNTMTDYTIRRRQSVRTLHQLGKSPIEIGDALDANLADILNDLRVVGTPVRDPPVMFSLGISDNVGLSRLERARAPIAPEADRVIDEMVEVEREKNKALNLPPRHGNSVTS